MKMHRALFLSSVTLSIFALWADVTVAQGPRGLPPEIRAQLSDTQIAQLEAATSFEEKKTLMDSWGIKPPERRGGHRMSEADRAKMDAIREQLKAATTDEERQQILDAAGLPAFAGHRPPRPEFAQEGVQ